MTDFSFETMTKAEFEHHLPEFFASGNGKVSTDPRLQIFLANNPDCAALVKDLETIAEYASSLFDPVDDPSDEVWAGIEAKLRDVAASAPNPAKRARLELTPNLGLCRAMGSQISLLLVVPSTTSNSRACDASSTCQHGQRALWNLQDNVEHRVH